MKKFTRGFEDSFIDDEQDSEGEKTKRMLIQKRRCRTPGFS
nr:hypothetical protein [Elizabethkingia bruuniana]